MTHVQLLYAFDRFVGDRPSYQELSHLIDHVSTELPHDGYIKLDPRIFLEPKTARRNLLVHSSCHSDQVWNYIHKYRQDVLDSCYLHCVISHRMDLNKPLSNNRLLWAMFANADLIIHNYLPPKFGIFASDVLFAHCKPGMRSVTFVPPSCACWWVLCEHHGECGVVELLKAGKSADEIVEIFLAGNLDSRFGFRFADQLDRLRHRERNRDVKISDYIVRRYKTHRMFYTYNHPTAHLMAYVTNECLAKLGFGNFGEEHSLTVPTNLSNFGNHYPDTLAAWDFYRFEYPMDCANERGGAHVYYPQVIREIAQRWEARNKQPAFVDIEDDL